MRTRTWKKRKALRYEHTQENRFLNRRAIAVVCCFFSASWVPYDVIDFSADTVIRVKIDMCLPKNDQQSIGISTAEVNPHPNSLHA